MTTSKQDKNAEAKRLGTIGCSTIFVVFVLIMLIGSLFSSDDEKVKLPADCENSPSCVAKINVGDSITGISIDRELLNKQRDMWKQIASQPEIQQAKVILEGPTTDIAGNSSTSPLLAVTCDRQAFTRINWDKVDPDGAKALCDWSEKVKFD